MQITVHKDVKEPLILTQEEKTLKKYLKNGGYETVKKIISKAKPKDIIKSIKESGLKGRGGAAFPVGIKWGVTAAERGEKKFVVCNADEGEPGTFKDRWILENRPHLIIEAMAICGYSVGANEGYVYMRGEYFNSIEIMKKAINEAHENNLLGNNIMGSKFSFDIKIKRGAGSYVCGEETALLESIEGKIAQPRFKPPFPGIKGLWGYPTVVQNVETFANIVPILKNGNEWFKQYGTKKSPGTKLYAISGSVERAGLIEANLGVNLKELLAESGGLKKGDDFKCALVGGAAGGFIYEDKLEVPLCYEGLKEQGKTLGSGSILVLSENDDIDGLIRNILDFFRHESCGKCTPCRNGYPKLVEMYDEYLLGKNNKEEMLSLANLMFKTSLCALGQSIKMPLVSYFNAR